MARLTDLRDVLDHLDGILKQTRTAEGVFRSVSEAETFGQRVTRLREALEKAATAEPSYALITGAAFPGLEGESLRVSYLRFAKLLSEVAEQSGTQFRLVKPAGRNRTSDELLCHFEGDSLSGLRLSHATSLDVESVSREGVAASGPSTYIPMSAWPDEPLVFVSFAVAETNLVDRFMRQLIANLPLRCRHRVRFWRFNEVTAESGILPGEENEAKIREAMGKCQFGLLLVSPTYVGRPFIERVELPHFTGPSA
ncbi:MAG: hypothetical protein KDL87_18640, partial [Verrucomicrobiae bacterium]|nr:hypothetical protein [Verrucomicrobiae bacterium]